MKVGSSVTTVTALLSHQCMVAAFVASLVAFAPSVQTSKLNLSLTGTKMVFEWPVCSEALSFDFCARKLKNAIGFRFCSHSRRICNWSLRPAVLGNHASNSLRAALLFLSRIVHNRDIDLEAISECRCSRDGLTDRLHQRNNIDNLVLVALQQGGEILWRRSLHWHSDCALKHRFEFGCVHVNRSFA